jgi:periplasmic protein CpxP/Spy
LPALRHGHRFLHGIDLTDAQKDQIFELKHAEATKIRAQIKKRRKLKQELM